MKILFQGKNA